MFLDCFYLFSFFFWVVSLVFIDHEFIGVEVCAEVFSIDEGETERDESANDPLDSLWRGREDKNGLASENELVEEEDLIEKWG